MLFVYSNGNVDLFKDVQFLFIEFIFLFWSLDDPLELYFYNIIKWK